MNRKIVIGIIIVVALLLAGGGIYFLAGRSEEPVDEGIVEENLPKISPEEIGLEILPSSDKRYIQFRLTKIDGIKQIEWEFTYDADAPDLGDGGGGRVTQGFGGEAEIDSGENEFVSERRELGTCSTGGKCRFDTGIEKVDLIIKVTKTNGQVFEAEDSITL